MTAGRGAGAGELPISVDDVEAAAERIRGHAVVTPLVESPRLNERLGGRLLVKAECLQRTGAFKYRGAVNRIAQLTPDELARGVIAFSSGNHAQAVARAAAVFGTTAVIVMPADAPQAKLRNTEEYGAEVVRYDRAAEDREEIGRRIAAERGLVLVPPFDDPHVMAGQGTAALEILDQVDGAVDALVVPISGGGLTAGCATVMAARSPATRIVAAEPEHYDDTRRSLAAGERVRLGADVPASICDAVLLAMPGELTWQVNATLLDEVVTVSDDRALAAMATALTELKLVIEPGGVIALAAALDGTVGVEGRTVVVIASGGNVDPAMLSRALEPLA